VNLPGNTSRKRVGTLQEILYGKSGKKNRKNNGKKTRQKKPQDVLGL
jgi:hypothetical protein